MEIPKRMQRLPIFKGLPMPWVQYVDSRGIPDFRIFDSEKRLDCIHEKWCGICGDPLDRIVAFIGGAGSLDSHLFSDPAMHSECARYAAIACPYLAQADYGHHSDRDPRERHPDALIKSFNEVQTKRPKRMGIGYTRSYATEMIHGTVYLRAGAWLSIDWEIMPESIDDSK